MVSCPLFGATQLILTPPVEESIEVVGVDIWYGFLAALIAVVLEYDPHP